MPGSNRELFHHAHYNVIAKRIREVRATYPIFGVARQDHSAGDNTNVQRALDMLVKDLGDWFSEDNPRFERDTWMEATNTNADVTA
jgi:hypothetical protein